MRVLLISNNFANRQSLQRTHEWFNRSDPTIFITIVSLAGLIVLAMCVGTVWQRVRDWRIEPAQREPVALFRRMLWRMGVSFLDRRRLWRLSRSLNLVHPTALLISDLYFDQCVEKYMASGKVARDAARELRALRAHLFGAPPKTS